MALAERLDDMATAAFSAGSPSAQQLAKASEFALELAEAGNCVDADVLRRLRAAVLAALPPRV